MSASPHSLKLHGINVQWTEGCVSCTLMMAGPAAVLLQWPDKWFRYKDILHQVVGGHVCQPDSWLDAAVPRNRYSKGLGNMEAKLSALSHALFKDTSASGVTEVNLTQINGLLSVLINPPNVVSVWVKCFGAGLVCVCLSQWNCTLRLPEWRPTGCLLPLD